MACPTSERESRALRIGSGGEEGLVERVGDDADGLLGSVRDGDAGQNQLSQLQSYFATMDPSTGKLIKMQMTPVQIKNFRINKASKADAYWLREILNREGKKFGNRIELIKDNILIVKWD